MCTPCRDSRDPLETSRRAEYPVPRAAAAAAREGEPRYSCTVRYTRYTALSRSGKMMKLAAVLGALAVAANAAPVARRQWRQLSADEKQSCVAPLG